MGSETAYELLGSIERIDVAALTFFVVSWFGYSLYADFPNAGKRSLMRRMHEYRSAWTRRMLARENRMVDIQVVNVLVANVSFFASATILIIGGLVAVLGASDAARAVIDDIPFAVETPRVVWDLKLLLLLVIFVYAFFKLTWALRQFNNLAVLIGATPEGVSPEGLACAERVALIASRAGDHFNRAMRAYYFGMAVLAWFIQPALFVFSTIWVLVIIYRREFRSKILQALGPVGTSFGPAPADDAKP